MKQKLLLGTGILLLVLFVWLAYLMFAMRDGPLGIGTWIVAALLLIGGSGLILWSKVK